MTKAELESKHLAELHSLAAEAGVPRYRMLPRAELVEALASAKGGAKAPAPRRRQRATAPAPTRQPAPKPSAPSPPSESAAPRPRRRRRRRFRRKGRGGGVREHATRWLEAWNAHDLEAIVGCYAEDVEYAAPAVVAGREDRRLRGREALREHFARGLELAPNLTVTEESLLVGPGGFAILYRREDGHRAVEAVELNDSGLVTQARVYYEREQS
jgi:SnoaL-like domain/Rho termination factor, N-terminal domain